MKLIIFCGPPATFHNLRGPRAITLLSLRYSHKAEQDVPK